MILKKLNIGNREMYTVLIIDSISDSIGNVALLKNDRENDPQPFVVAFGYDLENGTWSYGKYYDTLEQAKKIFYKGLIENGK